MALAAVGADELQESNVPEEPPGLSEQFVVTTSLAAEIVPDDCASEFADVELAWLDISAGKTRSVVLRSVSLNHTLAEFRQCCASALGVGSVKPQDFNEDMDSLCLNALGIGSSGLPFFVELGSTPVAEIGDKISISSASLGVTAAASEETPLPKPKRGSAGSLPQRQALKDASEIKDGWLFLGGNLSASNLAALQELGVTHVLNCCERVPCKFKKSLTYKVISVFDTKSSDIRQHFADAIAFIDSARASRGGVLVHCMVGASRSTSLVLAWLVARCQMPLLEAFRRVRAQRSVARPNRSFCQQLMEFETEVLGKQTASLADFGHK